MKRHRAWVIALVVIAAAIVVFRLGRQPGDAPTPPPPEAKLEITPEGWQRLKAEYEAKGNREVPLDIFLGPAIQQGKVLEAYESVSPVDRPKLFETFAVFMVAPRLSRPSWVPGEVSLSPLLDRFATDYPGDPRVTFFRACELSLQGKDAEAEPLFASVVPELGTERPLGLLSKRLWAECLTRLGRWEAAYDLIAGLPSTVGHFSLIVIGDIILARRDTKGLVGLIERHQKAEPGEPLLSYYRGEIHWLKQEYAEAAEQLAKYLEAARGGVGPHHISAADHRVRALIRLDRLADARAAAADAPASLSSYRRTWDAILTAKAGDAAAVLQLMDVDEKLRASAYQDEDLGPLLRTEPMAPVRAKYPPPGHVGTR